MPEHVLYVERTPRRVRVFSHGDAVADSDDVRLLHPSGRTPTYLFPRKLVRTELFQPADRRQSDPGMGERTYWDVRFGEHRKPNAAYCWQRPPDGAMSIAGLVAFDWELVQRLRGGPGGSVHPRDPYTRIDVLPSSRHVRVTLGNSLVADSPRPRMLIESGLPVRWYLPREDVCSALLEPSPTTTRCPDKGVAQYWSLRLPDRYEQDLVWSYPEPLTDAEAVGGLLCLPQDRVQMEVTADSRPHDLLGRHPPASS